MEAAKRWWIANREKHTSLFELELAEVFEQIKTAPLLGMHFQMHRGKEIRYVVTLKSKYGVFYRVESKQLVRIMSIWGGRQKNLPRFG